MVSNTMKTKHVNFSHAIQNLREATIVYSVIARCIGYLIVEEPMMFLKGVLKIALGVPRTMMKGLTSS